MVAGNRKVLQGGRRTATRGNVRPNTRSNQGRQANANPDANANVGAEIPPVDMGIMYQFFVNTMQARAAAGVDVGNEGGANPVAPVGNNYAKLSMDYASLGGKPFLGTEDAVGVENKLLHCERIFADLGLMDMQKRRLASRKL